MKCFRRYFCALLCCLLLLVASSVSVNAADDESIQIYQYHKYPNNISGASLTFIPNNGEVEKKEAEISSDDFPKGTYASVYRVERANKDILFEKGKSAEIKFNNVYFSLLVNEIYHDGAYDELFDKFTYISKPDSIHVVVNYSDGSSKTIYDGITFTQKNNSKALNIAFEFTPDKDVSTMAFFVKVDPSLSYTEHKYHVRYIFTTYCGEYEGDDRYQFNFEVETKTHGFLRKILEFVTGILQSIIDLPVNIWSLFVELFDTIFGWLEDLWNAVKEIPAALWGLIEEGLKALFVPGDSYIVKYKEDMDAMLSEKLGAVYQVVDITLGSWDRITANDIENIIDLPKVTIPLPNNNSFSFGGYEVPIVPQGFDWLVTILKTAIGIVCTVLFVNGLRKKYENVVGG